MPYVQLDRSGGVPVALERACCRFHSCTGSPTRKMGDGSATIYHGDLARRLAGKDLFVRSVVQILIERIGEWHGK